MRKLCVRCLAILSLTACQLEIGEPSFEELENQDKVQVRFFTEVSGASKGAISPDEMRINDINIYAFRNGVLEDYVHSTSLDNVVLSLTAGCMYNIYAVANMGECIPESTESTFIEAFAYGISDLLQLESGIPMSCVSRNLYVSLATQRVTLQMNRLAAKVVLSLDKTSLLKGLQATSIRLRQCASVVRPFKWEGRGGSRAVSSSETIDGDYATPDDLVRFNTGEQIVLYTLENCQGILLPENDDPLKKIPDELGDSSDRCTYLEVSCTFGSDGLFDGCVDYRIYLGLDSTSSFDVPGNSSINVSMMLTDGGLSQVSWKVDADVSIRDGYARGSIVKGMHQVTDLYVGEQLLYNVELADELKAYLGSEIDGCYLQYSQDGNMSDGIRVNSLQWDGNSLLAELECLRPGSGELYLFSSEGECLGCLEGKIMIKTPRILVSDNYMWVSDDPVDPLDHMPECEVNGMPAEFYLYFVDDQGRSLNCNSAYGFDHTLFEFQYTGATSGKTNLPMIHSYFESLGGGAPGYAAAKLSVFCENDGLDHDKNVLLSEIFCTYTPIYVSLKEKSFATFMELSVGLEIPQIRLSLVDNGWAKYHDCQLSAVVDNPSNLPLQVSVWQLLSSNLKYGAVDETYVEKNLLREEILYMTGEFYNNSPPLYGSRSSFTFERNEYGSSALEIDGTLVFPLTGISTEDLIRALYYDKIGNHQMIHSVDISMNGFKIGGDNVVLDDDVSGSSTSYHYIYYSQDSWNYRGACLYSCGEFISSSGLLAYDYPNVSAYNLDILHGRHASPIILSLGYHSGSKMIVLSTNSNSVAKYDMSISILYDGVVNGYVQTHPKGTWYAAQDNYCTVEIAHTSVGLPLKTNASFVFADDRKINEAIAGVYEFSYLDSPKPLGADSYYHRAHPVDLNLSVSLGVEGDEKNELYPVKASWSTSVIEYYHQQDDTNYKCSLDVDIECFKVVVVSRK